MWKRFIPFVAVALPIIVMSCSKENKVENPLTGKWLLREVYSGYANGGNFKWDAVSYQNAHSIEFTDGGQFVRREHYGINPTVCTGTYRLVAGQTLQLNAPCENATVKISELTSAILILDYQVREEVIRYKYVPER